MMDLFWRASLFEPSANERIAACLASMGRPIRLEYSRVFALLEA
jgi:hypothetical protein